MASKVILDDTTRSNIFASLTEKQKDFLQQHVKRGKKTTFANVMALDKGIVLPNNATDAEIQAILDEWILIEYIDNGERNANTPCECGRINISYSIKPQKKPASLVLLILRNTQDFQRTSLNKSKMDLQLLIMSVTSYL